jgi:hypothetical protein
MAEYIPVFENPIAIEELLEDGIKRVCFSVQGVTPLPSATALAKPLFQVEKISTFVQKIIERL